MSKSAKEYAKSYQGFSVKLRSGDSSKKKMSNHLTVTVPGERADTTVRFTLREARSLKSFLESSLGE